MCRAIKYKESCVLQCMSLLLNKIQWLAYRPVVYWLTERALSREGIYKRLMHINEMALWP